MQNNIDALIFDLDGTLWDANNTYLNAWNTIMQDSEHKLSMTIEDMQSVMGWEQKAAWNKLFPHLADSDWKPIAQNIDILQVQLAATQGGILYKDVAQYIPPLSQKYSLHIVSNCPEALIPAFYKYSGLQSYFTDYEEHGRTKLSKSENIKLIIQRNNIKNAIYIGDTESDRKHATLAGLPFVYMTYGFGKLTQPPYLKFDTFAELALYFLP
ncbi:MAG: HAD hydrolase-like protein [Cytophagales bacterium]|nr:HAD hydrolase-like protein [Cytophagales bacterium]